MEFDTRPESLQVRTSDIDENTGMKTVALPIETKTREFDGKLWLSMNLACSGYKVALGYRNPMRKQALSHIEPDLFITKAAAKSNSRINLFRKLENTDCTIAVLDAEGGVMPSKEYYFEKRISESILKSVDLFFAWGSEPADAIREGSSFSEEKIVTTGNPRFDLTHPDLRNVYSEKANTFRNRHGQYLLVNTNFTRSNNKREGYSPPSGSRTKYDMFILDEFIKAIYKIKSINGLDTVVVRPHPSEDSEFYRKEFADLPSIIIDQSDDVRSWIMGAEVVLHNSCTTGIESAMLNTPVLAFEPNYAPIESPRPPLANTVSETITNLDDLVSRIEHYLDWNSPYEMSTEQQSALEKWFGNVNEPATPKIVKTINEVVETKDRSYPVPPLIDRMESWAKHGPISPVIESILRRDFERSEYSKQKFPGLTINEVRQRISDFEMVGEIDNIQIEAVHPYYDIYWIYKE